MSTDQHWSAAESAPPASADISISQSRAKLAWLPIFFGLLFALCLTEALGHIGNPFAAWSGSLSLGALFALLIVRLIRPSRVSLHRDYFEFRRLGETQRVAWLDIEPLYVFAPRFATVVAYRYRPDRQPQDLFRKSSFKPYILDRPAPWPHGNLPPWLAGKPDDVKNLMNDYRQRAEAMASVAPRQAVKDHIVS